MSILKIRDSNGNVQDVLVIRGEDGHTPVKGVDYLTEEEVISLAKQVAGKISFTLDEDGNLYYEVEE